MTVVDERGRLFGRLNLFDAVLLLLVLGLIPLGYAAYALFRERPPRLLGVTPAVLRLSADPQTVVVTGEHLRPYMRVSAGTHQATGFIFKSTTEAEVPFAKLPPGEYDLVLYDQAQERSRLPKALTILPSALPPTEMVAVGAFGNLDAGGAAKITPGLELTGAGKVLAVGRPVPDLTQVFSAPGRVGVPIADALRVPAAVLFRCYVRTEQGRPYCMLDDTAIERTNVLLLATPLGNTPFQIEQVRSPHPLEPVPIQVRLTGHPSVLSLIRAGDVDLAGTTNELALIATVERVGGVRRTSEATGEVDVNLIAQLQRIDGS